MVTEGVRDHVTARHSSVVIRREAASEGMLSLRDDGIRKVLEGVTTLDEVMRVTQEDVVEGG